MRILHYYPRATVGDGGPSIAVRGWVAGLREAGASVSIAYDAATRADDPADVAVGHRGSGRRRVPVGLRDVLPPFDLLVLHSGWVAHNVVAARAARRAGTPYVVTPHGAYAPEVLRRGRRWTKRVWWTALERPLLRRAAAVHVFFAEEAVALREAGYDGEVVVSPNGVSVPEAPRWDGGSGGYVLWLGRFDVHNKGLDLLVDAVRRIEPGRRPLLRLHGPDWRGGRAAVERLVHDAGVSSHVVIGDPVYGDAKWDALRRARCFVYPSRWEAFGLAAAEAAALGVPVIGTATGPFLRRMSEQGCAVAVPPDARALADALLSDAASLGDMGGRAEALMKSDYTWDAAARRFLTAVEALA